MSETIVHVPLSQFRHAQLQPRVEIELPTLHPGQVKALATPGRFRAIRAGRRFGKTLALEAVACDAAIRGEFVGWFAPQYRYLAEAYRDIAMILAPVTDSASKMEGVIRTTAGGRIDFWTLDNPHAGRSRRYHKVIIDEAAFTPPNTLETWRRSIQPTLLDYRGSALVASNTNGRSLDNFFYLICNDPKHRFLEYHAPSRDNPYLSGEELDELQATTHPLVFRQEYLAEFVSFAGESFFAEDSLLVNGQPVASPTVCDAVYFTIDTAIKDKAEHDATFVVFWALDQHGMNRAAHKLTILDYDIQSIQGSMLEVWLPWCYQRANELAQQCRARHGSLGAWIEDKVSGTILLQQAKRRGWAATAIDSKLTELGKDARAISVSGYVHQGLIKFSETAYNRVIPYKDMTRNHLLSQIVDFRVDVDSGADDGLDAFCYGIAVALGDRGGF